MYDRRIKNIEIFKDTDALCKTNKKLISVIANSVKEQEIIFADTEINTEMDKVCSGKIVLSGKRTLEAAELYAKRGKKVCVLNFASATNPGGGVTTGSSAQEEAICRCSTLYSCLNVDKAWEQFYIPHKESKSLLYNDDCIYTPAVKVFKSDTNFPELMEEEKWWDVDVITCAAPNLKCVPTHLMKPGIKVNSKGKKLAVTYEELRFLLLERIEKIYKIAFTKDVEVLILGAFGCGAFRNPPKLMAEVFAEITEKYRKCFEVIEYAIFCADYESENFSAFEEKMKRFL